MDAVTFFNADCIKHAFKSYDEARLAVNKQDGPKVSYFIKKITKPMDCQDADILVGFYSNEDTTFSINIGNNILPSRNLPAETFEFAVNYSIVPLIKLVYHNVDLVLDKPVDMYGVFACLPQNDRITLVNYDVIYRTHSYSRGMFGIVNTSSIHAPDYTLVSETEKFTIGFFIKKFIGEPELVPIQEQVVDADADSDTIAAAS